MTTSQNQDVLPEPNIIELLAEEIEAMSTEDRERTTAAVAAICDRLDKEALEQVGKKSSIEQRWIQDLRQYHGRYEPGTEAALDAAKQSKVFANLTRPKTNAWSARIGDILFPTDDKNWAMGPTPVPTPNNKLEKSRAESRKLIKQANLYSKLASTAIDQEYADNMRVQEKEAAAKAQPFAQAAIEAAHELEEAKTVGEAMEKENEDQLVESKFGEKCRVGIKDMTKIGTVVMKGPLSKSRIRGGWTVADGEWKLDVQTDPRPEWNRVDPWDFFPDMNARTIDECEFFYERHAYTKSQLRKLARKPGFDRNQIRELLKSKPMEQAPNYLQSIREITNNQNVSLENRYIVWEYHGPLTGAEIDSIARSIMNPNDAATVISTLEEEDPLVEQKVVLWFSDGKPLKLGPLPLDSGDSVYSAACFVEDTTSIFGFGVPYLARNAQSIINAAWRMMMDNADISVGNQIVINQNILEPADGDWHLRGMKAWLYQTGKTLPPGSAPPFESFNTPSNLQYLLEVVKLAMVFLDEEISLPLVAQGEAGAHVETAEGRGMLMNAANVIFRDAVRNWDDKITVPCLTRNYHWNMQHNPKEHIKGDMEVEARGSSVLLVRDMQSKNLTEFLRGFGESEVYAPYIKHVDGLRELSKTMMIESSKLVMTDEELAEEEEKQATAPPPPPSPDEIKLEIARMAGQTAMDKAVMDRETQMMKLSQTSGLSMEKIQADLLKNRESLAQKDREIAAKERATAVDAALTQRQMVVKATAPNPNISTTGTVQ